LTDPSEPLGIPISAAGASTATRKDVQLGRRLVHLANGSAIATAYALLFTHQQIIHVLGTLACVVYVLDRIRIHYPELAQRLPTLNALFFRAEEQVKEAAMTPYVIAILLTVLTFPKVVALIAIYTLAIADPLAAIVGIRFGRRHLVPNRTVEGSLAFFTAAFAVSFGVLTVFAGTVTRPAVGASLVVATAAALFEMIPLRIDDNLTIPIFVGFSTWIACVLAGVPLH
jgi:dolichol kinase